MDIEKLDINAVCFGILCNFTPVCGEEKAKEAVALIRSLQTENEKLRAELERVKKKNKYSAHDVALILSDAFGDSCACNFNGNDEWLPEKCELLDTCPDVVGVACWEQYLKWLGQKED